MERYDLNELFADINSRESCSLCLLRVNFVSFVNLDCAVMGFTKDTKEDTKGTKTDVNFIAMFQRNRNYQILIITSHILTHHAVVLGDMG